MAIRNALTLSRAELYELVWSKPVTEVAKDLGLSDVAVAKRCRQVQVPVPPRGYWARVSAGQSPRRTPLPKYRDSSASAVRAKRATVLKQADVVESRQELEADRQDDAGLPGIPEPTVTFHRGGNGRQSRQSYDHDDSGPQSPHFAALNVKLSALAVPADAPENWSFLDDITAHPPGWPEKFRTPSRLPVIAVHSKASMLRARRITTHLIGVITELGWRFIPETPDPPQRPYYHRTSETPDDIERRSAHFLVEDERLFVSITERQTRTERPFTPAELRERQRDPFFYCPDRYSYHPSGELTLNVSSSPGRGSGFASFRDSKRTPLERKLSDIVRRLLKGALDIKDRRQAAAEAAERRRQEEQRQERIRSKRKAYTHLISRLEAESGAWERAQRLRRYLRAARRALAPGTSIEAALEGESVDLLALGEQFADQLDPLHPSPRTAPFFSETDLYGSGYLYESDEAKLRKIITRFVGVDWRSAPKEISPQIDSAGLTDAGQSWDGLDDKS